MVRRILLVCGILSSLLYAALMMLIRYPGYSALSQSVSELSAVGVPSRYLWIVLSLPYEPLLVAFGVGVWMSARGNQFLRITGALLAAYGTLGLIVWPFAAMHQRQVLAAGGGTFQDTLHLTFAMVSVLLMFAVIAFGAAAFRRQFRAYSIVTIAVFLVFGALTTLDASKIGANLPTPWVGVWERINIAAFLVWVIALASLLLPGVKVEPGSRVPQ